MDNWFDREEPFFNEEDEYDDLWLRPCDDEWEDMHPFGHNPFDEDNPWGVWDNAGDFF